MGTLRGGELVIISVLEHAPIRFDDGTVETVRVRLLRNDRTIANTGRGFENLHDADLFADGMAAALGPRTVREYLST